MEDDASPRQGGGLPSSHAPRPIAAVLSPTPALSFRRSTLRSSGRRFDTPLAYLFLSPALVLLALVLGYPVAWGIWVSLTDFSPLNDGPAAFVGLRNYGEILASPEFRHATVVTVLYALVTSAVKLALGVGFALLLAEPFRGRTLAFLAIFLPWAYPASVSVIGWYWTLSPPIPTSYSAFMGTLKWSVDSALGTGAWSFLSVTLFNIWRGSSFIGVFLLAGINAVPPELFECALLESRSAWRRFWLVTVPLLKPFFALAIFLSLTTAFTDLANVWMLTAGRIIFPVIGTHAYFLAIRGGQFGLGAALSFMIVPLLLVVLVLLFRIFDPPEERA